MILYQPFTVILCTACRHVVCVVNAFTTHSVVSVIVADASKGEEQCLGRINYNCQFTWFTSWLKSGP